MRPMALASHQVLYIGTHQGRLQRVQLPSPGLPERWEQLWQNGRREALMCLAVRPSPLTVLSVFQIAQPAPNFSKSTR